MERLTADWMRNADADLAAARRLAPGDEQLYDQLSFHGQYKAAEKYLKALLQENGIAVSKTHDLKEFLDLLLPIDITLAPLRRMLVSLSRYAVEFRYPGARATLRRMTAALRRTERIRGELRTRLGLML